jgi:hypothetical protein
MRGKISLSDSKGNPAGNQLANAGRDSGRALEYRGRLAGRFDHRETHLPRRAIVKTSLSAASLVLVLSITTIARADDKKAPGKYAGLEPFKQLAGEWVCMHKMHGEEAQEMHVTYKVTSGGSAVVETIGPGTPHEMVTVIHPDGDDLVLTHYCMLGNQPTMKASGNPAGNKVDFKFVHASNMKSDKDMHMHDVSYTFVDKDNLKAEWTHYNDGKPAGNAVFEAKRVK